MLRSPFTALFMVIALVALPVAFGGEDDEDAAPAAPSVIDFSAIEISGELRVTQGGAQDIGYFRDVAERGGVPLPETFTPEGLFSEHHLEAPAGEPCTRLFCVTGEAMQAALIVQPEVTHLAQLGFSTSMTAETFQRPPLNLVAVIDRSCSMNGLSMDTVKASLREVIDTRLAPGDQLSLVTYGADVSLVLAPTTERTQMREALDSVVIDGSTNLEAGLTTGFEVARESRRAFDGITRVMLFTDERPNTGRTDAEAFMTLARRASGDGIGLTTIGVGTDYGAELAATVSGVRGGNLFYFPDKEKMIEVFHEDFDTMVVELAYDMVLEVTPAPGSTVAGVYGVPGDAIAWTDGGALRMEVATLFLSKRAGAIFVAFSSEADAVGTVHLEYTPRDGVRQPQTLALPVTRASGEGLRLGHLLVDEATTLKKATAAHHQGDSATAYVLLSELAVSLERGGEALSEERALVQTVRQAVGGRAGLDPISNLPIR